MAAEGDAQAAADASGVEPVQEAAGEVTPPERPTHSTVNEPSAQTLELAKLLLEANLTIAVAESLTGGALGAEIVRVPGISGSFLGGIISYQDDIKHDLLGVDKRLLKEHGAVHRDVALQMAQGVRKKFKMFGRNADIGVSTTGVAGPEPSSKDQPAGTVFVGVSSLWGDHVSQLDFSNLVRENDPVGSRQRIRFATIESAIFNVIEHLANQAEL
ncbi:CinA family protein [Gulosibacter molinativorax]|uniref:CinA family protein n=2 Tax=Gulosibacter molinativorax TaxID=256821 RepID=A0ABT7C9Y5_9MICO|nr:CinA family protein [Gulosibacter molinativorax]